MKSLLTCILLLLLAAALAACTPAAPTLPRTYLLAQRDAAGHAYVVTETRYLGADANFAVLKLWRAAAGERVPLLQLTLDDWCGNPIAWQLAPDGIVVPAAPAAPRQDPENPDKCAAQPTRAYILRGGQVVMEER
jgi:hypothetical protein